MTPSAALRALASQERVPAAERYFKTGPGEYAEGDMFLGVTVPDVRKVARQFSTIPLQDVEKLLTSRIHEERLLALLILGDQYPSNPKAIVKFYLDHRAHVNNWDLVDSSAHQILGRYLQDKDPVLLINLAHSHSIWDRRIAMVSTYAFIRNSNFEHTLQIAEILLRDPHDLIQKASGWMLREVGKKDKKVLETFLRKHAKNMPRTTLRYAIEKFNEAERTHYMNR